MAAMRTLQHISRKGANHTTRHLECIAATVTAMNLFFGSCVFSRLKSMLGLSNSSFNGFYYVHKIATLSTVVQRAGPANPRH
jgi:hypothetical protein